MEFSGLLAVVVFTGIFASIYALLSLGLNLQWGFTGLFNVGIAGFYAIGAYTSAILTMPRMSPRARRVAMAHSRRHARRRCSPPGSWPISLAG